MLRIERIDPQSKAWQDFIVLGCEYFQRHWPNVYTNNSETKIQELISSDLKQRFKQGDRGFFIMYLNDEPFAIANAWLSKDDDIILNVAEFYVRDEYHRHGLGKALWQNVISWGQSLGAVLVELETDELKPANFFWKSLGLTVTQTAPRLRYSLTLVNK
ncbi:GNAT family N-acetyltransferase [Acinetobacter radioresistens]|uniref:GNAT family N-acetyltransferase n=1 Tax=Acinetobacter radioresistens TaxID=40216 RepID=UPI0020058F90|nr:GNAT family N-acetyltransferase [Acinetobacter radioresistens]MCK4108622.1 GNAT family N-acetyltransferase [Acinetobacter radioresistens]